MADGLLKRWTQALMIRRTVELCPDGICFGALNGRPVLVNRKMDALSKKLLHHSILNTAELWQQLQQHKIKEQELPASLQERTEVLFMRDSDGAVWQFERKPIGRYMQYTASDISQLYHLQETFSRNIAELRERQDRQRDLLEEIVANNRSSELLSAKIRIHDDFGQCLIASRQALKKGSDPALMNRLLRRWKYCVDSMLVSGVQPEEQDSTEEELLKAAEMIGCRILFEGDRPESRNTRLLLYAAVREALTNAVRHSGATGLSVTIQPDCAGYAVEIADNGSAAPKEIREGNGLSNLRRRLEQAGAVMDVRCENGVKLCLHLPKGE